MKALNSFHFINCLVLPAMAVLGVGAKSQSVVLDEMNATTGQYWHAIVSKAFEVEKVQLVVPNETRHVTTVSEGQLDSLTGDVLSLEGREVIFLGDGGGVDGKAATATWEFTTRGSSHAFLDIAFYLVIQSIHGPKSDAFFEYTALDQKGDEFVCGKQRIVAAKELGLTQLPDSLTDRQRKKIKKHQPHQRANTYFTGWVHHLVPLNGRTSGTLRWTVGDCSAKGHHAYAAIAARTRDLQLKVDGVFSCSTSEPVTAVAPEVAGGYLWSTGASTRAIALTQPGKVSVTLLGLSPNNCRPVVLSTEVAAPVDGPSGGHIQTIDTLSCENLEPVQLTAPEAYGYKWSNGASSRSITTFEGGDYRVDLLTVRGGPCIRRLSTTVTADYPRPDARFAPSPSIDSLCAGSQVRLLALDSTVGIHSWHCSDGGRVTESPQYWSSPVSGTHTLTHIVQVGRCRDSVSVDLPVQPYQRPVVLTRVHCTGEKRFEFVPTGINEGNVRQVEWSVAFGSGTQPEMVRSGHSVFVPRLQDSLYSVRVRVLDRSGCHGDTSALITALPGPEPLLTIKRTGEVMDFSVTVVDSSRNGRAWMWSTPGAEQVLDPNGELVGCRYSTHGEFEIALDLTGDSLTCPGRRETVVQIEQPLYSIAGPRTARPQTLPAFELMPSDCCDPPKAQPDAFPTTQPKTPETK